MKPPVLYLLNRILYFSYYLTRLLPAKNWLVQYLPLLKHEKAKTILSNFNGFGIVPNLRV